MGVGAQFSFPFDRRSFRVTVKGNHRKWWTWTIGDSDGEQRDQTHRDSAGRRADANNAPHFEPWVGGTPSTYADVVEESPNGPESDGSTTDTVIFEGASEAGEEEFPEVLVEIEAEMPLPRQEGLRRAFAGLDEVDPCTHFPAQGSSHAVSTEILGWHVQERIENCVGRDHEK